MSSGDGGGKKLAFANDGSFMARFQEMQRKHKQKAAAVLRDAAGDGGPESKRRKQTEPAAPAAALPPPLPPPPTAADPRAATNQQGSAAPSASASAGAAGGKAGAAASAGAAGGKPNIQNVLAEARRRAALARQQQTSGLPTPPHAAPMMPPPGAPPNEVRIPAECVGRVIGRGGSQLRAIEAKTGCRISIARENLPGTNMKVVTMVGPPTQMAECRGSILESAGIGAGAVQAASGSVITAAEIERKLSDRGKHGYDSDEDVEGGTWEHRKRAAEMKKTADEAARLTAAGQRRHHISHYLPKDVLENHLEQANATWEGREADYSEYKKHQLTRENKGYQMLQQAGWSEGQGLGAQNQGRAAPVGKGAVTPGTLGIGMEKPAEVKKEDDAFEEYRKRMMKAYRFRPNPLNNPRRAYDGYGTGTQ